ncbi:hypothetical protein B566_EDAN012428 [Ephemera danica]|nr:hypothetical protein B566_EDAN012428 [Ephemera danica]
MTKKHNPLDLNEEDILDLFNTSLRWFQTVHRIDPTAKYPVMIWDNLPHAGASQLHPHLHGMLDPEQYYGAIHIQYEAAKKYSIYTDNDYWEDFIEIHHALGFSKNIREPTSLACGHHFCHACIVWLANEAELSRDSAKCPTCCNKFSIEETVTNTVLSKIFESVDHVLSIARIGKSIQVTDDTLEKQTKKTPDQTKTITAKEVKLMGVIKSRLFTDKSPRVGPIQSSSSPALPWQVDSEKEKVTSWLKDTTPRAIPTQDHPHLYNSQAVTESPLISVSQVGKFRANKSPVYAKPVETKETEESNTVKDPYEYIPSQPDSIVKQPAKRLSLGGRKSGGRRKKSIEPTVDSKQSPVKKSNDVEEKSPEMLLFYSQSEEYIKKQEEKRLQEIEAPIPVTKRSRKSTDLKLAAPVPKVSETLPTVSSESKKTKRKELMSTEDTKMTEMEDKIEQQIKEAEDFDLLIETALANSTKPAAKAKSSPGNLLKLTTKRKRRLSEEIKSVATSPEITHTEAEPSPKVTETKKPENSRDLPSPGFSRMRKMIVDFKSPAQKTMVPLDVSTNSIPSRHLQTSTEDKSSKKQADHMSTVIESSSPLMRETRRRSKTLKEIEDSLVQKSVEQDTVSKEDHEEMLIQPTSQEEKSQNESINSTISSLGPPDFEQVKALENAVAHFEHGLLDVSSEGMTTMDDSVENNVNDTQTSVCFIENSVPMDTELFVPPTEDAKTSTPQKTNKRKPSSPQKLLVVNHHSPPLQTYSKRRSEPMPPHQPKLVSTPTKVASPKPSPEKNSAVTTVSQSPEKSQSKLVSPKPSAAPALSSASSPQVVPTFEHENATQQVTQMSQTTVKLLEQLHNLNECAHKRKTFSLDSNTGEIMTNIPSRQSTQEQLATLAGSMATTSQNQTEKLQPPKVQYKFMKVGNLRKFGFLGSPLVTFTKIGYLSPHLNGRILAGRVEKRRRNTTHCICSTRSNIGSKILLRDMAVQTSQDSTEPVVPAPVSVSMANISVQTSQAKLSTVAMQTSQQLGINVAAQTSKQLASNTSVQIQTSPKRNVARSMQTSQLVGIDVSAQTSKQSASESSVQTSPKRNVAKSMQTSPKLITSICVQWSPQEETPMEVEIIEGTNPQDSVPSEPLETSTPLLNMLTPKPSTCVVAESQTISQVSRTKTPTSQGNRSHLSETQEDEEEVTVIEKSQEPGLPMRSAKLPMLPPGVTSQATIDTVNSDDLIENSNKSFSIHSDDILQASIPLPNRFNIPLGGDEIAPSPSSESVGKTSSANSPTSLHETDGAEDNDTSRKRHFSRNRKRERSTVPITDSESDLDITTFQKRLNRSGTKKKLSLATKALENIKTEEVGSSASDGPSKKTVKEDLAFAIRYAKEHPFSPLLEPVSSPMTIIVETSSSSEDNRTSSKLETDEPREVSKGTETPGKEKADMKTVHAGAHMDESLVETIASNPFFDATEILAASTPADIFASHLLAKDSTTAATPVTEMAGASANVKEVEAKNSDLDKKLNMTTACALVARSNFFWLLLVAAGSSLSSGFYVVSRLTGSSQWSSLKCLTQMGFLDQRCLGRLHGVTKPQLKCCQYPMLLTGWVIESVEQFKLEPLANHLACSLDDLFVSRQNFPPQMLDLSDDDSTSYTTNSTISTNQC